MTRRPPLSILVALFTAAAGTLAPGCGKPEELPTINVGLVAELTGNLSVFGTASKNAAELKVSEIEQKGGIEIGGKKYRLKLVISDSESTPQGAVADAQSFIKDDTIVALIGPNASLEAVPVADAAEAAGMPMISPASTAPRTTLDASGKPKQWVFRTCFTDAWQGAVLAKFADGYVRAKKAAVLYEPSSEAPKIQAEIFKQDFEKAGGQVVAFETFKSGDQDFSQVLGKIKKAGPDVVFLSGYYNDVALQLRQAKKAGISCPFLGSDDWSPPELLKVAAKDLEGSFYSAHYQPDRRNEITGAFVIAYKKRFADAVPDDIAALTYDALGLLVEALRIAGKPDRAAIREGLAQIRNYEGVTGKLAFSVGSRDPVKNAVMYKIEGGKPSFVTNIEP